MCVLGIAVVMAVVVIIVCLLLVVVTGGIDGMLAGSPPPPPPPPLVNHQYIYTTTRTMDTAQMFLRTGDSDMWPALNLDLKTDQHQCIFQFSSNYTSETLRGNWEYNGGGGNGGGRSHGQSFLEVVKAAGQEEEGDGGDCSFAAGSNKLLCVRWQPDSSTLFTASTPAATFSLSVTGWKPLERVLWRVQERQHQEEEEEEASAGDTSPPPLCDEGDGCGGGGASIVHQGIMIWTSAASGSTNASKEEAKLKGEEQEEEEEEENLAIAPGSRYSLSADTLTNSSYTTNRRRLFDFTYNTNSKSTSMQEGALLEGTIHTPVFPFTVVFKYGSNSTSRHFVGELKSSSEGWLKVIHWEIMKDEKEEKADEETNSDNSDNNYEGKNSVGDGCDNGSGGIGSDGSGGIAGSGGGITGDGGGGSCGDGNSGGTGGGDSGIEEQDEEIVSRESSKDICGCDESGGLCHSPRYRKEKEELKKDDVAYSSLPEGATHLIRQNISSSFLTYNSNMTKYVSSEGVTIKILQQSVLPLCPELSYTLDQVFRFPAEGFGGGWEYVVMEWGWGNMVVRGEWGSSILKWYQKTFTFSFNQCVPVPSTQLVLDFRDMSSFRLWLRWPILASALTASLHLGEDSRATLLLEEVDEFEGEDAAKEIGRMEADITPAGLTISCTHNATRTQQLHHTFTHTLEEAAAGWEMICGGVPASDSLESHLHRLLGLPPSHLWDSLLQEVGLHLFGSGGLQEAFSPLLEVLKKEAMVQGVARDVWGLPALAHWAGLVIMEGREEQLKLFVPSGVLTVAQHIKQWMLDGSGEQCGGTAQMIECVMEALAVKLLER